MNPKANLPSAEPAHNRTPENTPIPGGGSWTWDAVTGSWLAPVADPVAAPILNETTPE